MASREQTGRAVLVTGASSGIGRAAALRFAACRADVVLAARRVDRLEAVAAEVRAAGARAWVCRCDVTDDAQVRETFERVGRELGGLDVLVNNAGLGLYGAFEQVSDAQLRQVFEVNVFGLARVTRAALPLLRRRPGAQVINVSSVLGHRGLPMLSGYSASKAAVNALTDALRVELEPEGIEVLRVSPGVTDTEFRAVGLRPEGLKREDVPVEAMPADEVAEAIVEASRTGRRDTVLTAAGRAMVYANRIAPALFDRVARRMVGK